MTTVWLTFGELPRGYIDCLNQVPHRSVSDMLVLHIQGKTWISTKVHLFMFAKLIYILKDSIF